MTTFGFNFILLIIIILIDESVVLRLKKIIIPSYPIRGQNVLLECDYEMGDDVLYSVKWYRDNEEFYRYLPKNRPPRHSYKLEGVKVDMHSSDDKKVSLNSVTLKSSGTYRCEVSAEAPSFASAQGEGKMEVIYLPKEGPRITGKEQEFKSGDLLTLNCTSGRSYPASKLSWFINNVEVTDESMLINYPPTYHAHGLISTMLGIRIPTGTTVQVRCMATVTPSSSREGRTEHGDSREAMLLVKSGTSSYQSCSCVVSIGFIISFINLVICR